MASFKSVLEIVGGDVKKVFAWIGSPKGQAVIAAGEGVAETVAPQLDGLISLGNQILGQAFQVESLAAAAGQQNGSGAQKLTAVVAAATPQVLAYAKQYGLPVPSATEIQSAVNGLVAFANALQGAAPTA